MTISDLVIFVVAVATVLLLAVIVVDAVVVIDVAVIIAIIAVDVITGLGWCSGRICGRRNISIEWVTF